MINNIEISTEKYLNSYNEFLEKTKDKSNYILLDKKVDEISEIYIINIKNSYNIEYKVAVFISVYGLKPQILQKNSRVYISYNNKVSIIDLNSFEVLKTIEKYSYNYICEVLELKSEDYLLIVSELEIDKIDLDGNIKWHKDTDFIKDYHTEENSIVIKTDEKIQKFDIENGNTTFEKML